MNLIDTHTHLFLEEFDNDRHQVVQRAIAEGVELMLLPNVDLSTIDPMMELHHAYPQNCLPMMGLHPTSVKADYVDVLKIIKEKLKAGKFVAIGEIGMDLYWDKSFLAEQRDAFRTQIVWAKECGLPVVIHTRDSFDEAYRIVKEEQDGTLSGVFHSFTGTLQEARKAVDLGFYIGVGGIATFKNAGVAGVVQQIDLNHIVIETDAPYLAPVPKRGKRNESAYVYHIAVKLAQLHSQSVAQVAKITSYNAQKLFKLNNTNHKFMS